MPPVSESELLGTRVADEPVSGVSETAHRSSLSSLATTSGDNIGDGSPLVAKDGGAECTTPRLLSVELRSPEVQRNASCLRCARAASRSQATALKCLMSSRFSSVIKGGRMGLPKLLIQDTYGRRSVASAMTAVNHRRSKQAHQGVLT